MWLALTDGTAIDKALPPTPNPAPGAPQRKQSAVPQPPAPAHEKKSGKDEKKELMDRMQPNGSRPVDMAQQKGDRWEKDPTTGGDVLIRDPKIKRTPCL